jgi:hypothetical protein
LQKQGLDACTKSAYQVVCNITYSFSGMLSATASLGLVLLWDVDGGLTPIDKYLYSAEDYIKVSFCFFLQLTFNILEKMYSELCRAVPYTAVVSCVTVDV